MLRFPGNRLFTKYGFAFLMLLNGNLLLAGDRSSKDQFQFPHFFTQSPGSEEKFILRFSKGQMQFADREVSFLVVQAKSNAGDLKDPVRLMQAPEAASELIRLEFLKANRCIPAGAAPLASKSNYFLGTGPGSWKSDVQNYNSLEYVNLYKNINLKYYVLNGEVKYDYTVLPGGLVSEIKMKYSGIRSLTVDKQGTLCIRTHLTELKDYLPKSYQVIDGKEIPVRVRYRLLGNHTVGFTADAYNTDYPLIIDPALIYSTFVGGSADEYQWVGGIDRDASGNIFHTGRSFSANFPTTAGVVQTSFGGNYDAFVFKLDPSGTSLIYSTYLGGVGMDAGYSVKVEQATGNLWVTGSTDSPTFPVTAGAFQTVLGGSGLTDAWVLKLNATGNTVMYSTLFGQAYSDYAAGIDVDNLGEVYISGKCNGAVFTTAGAFQTAYGGGPWDGFVAKFNSTLSAVVYSTLFGSNQHEVPIAIAVDANHDIYIAGFEEGGAMPTVAGSFDVTYNGGAWDAFVTKFNSTLSGMVYSTYLGTSGTDMIWNALQVNGAGEAVVAGFAANGFPTTAGAFQTVYGGGPQDVFVAKLNAAGTGLVYSTYLGGTGDDEAYGVFLESNGDVYVTGYCQANFPVTICTYDSTYNGGKDAFLFQLNPNATQLLFSTYFGGSNDDLGYNITKLNTTTYVVGETQSANFPISAGAYDTGYNGARDIFAFAMMPSTITVIADFNSMTSVCLNGPIQFNNTSLNATSYSWDFGDGSTSTLQNPIHTFSVAGWHNVQLIASAPCAIADTMVIPVNVIDPPVAAFNTSIPCGLTADFTDASTGAVSWAWNFGDGGTSSTASPSHTYATDGTYTVTLIATNAYGCSDTVSGQVIINPVAVAAFTTAASQCGLNASFQNTSLNATSVTWYFGDGTSTTAANPSHTYSDTGTYTVMLIADPGQCADTMVQTVSLHAFPVALFTSADLCDLTLNFINNSTGGNSYTWDFGDTQTSSLNSPSHTYAQDGNYTVVLIVQNSYGCRDTLVQQVQVNPVPVAGFTFIPPLCSRLVSFQNTSQNASAYYWIFGDGTSSSGSDVSHLYGASGNYTVTLISDPGACADTISQTLVIYDAPESAFSGLASCDLEYNLVNQSLGGVSYLWDFGDASTSAAVAPSHTYPFAGSYLITLVTTNQAGCTDTSAQLITIYDNPVAGFSYSAIPCTLYVPFQNSSSNAVSYLWDFGDGTTSTEVSPDHQFSNSGAFEVLLITNPGGCADSMLQVINVVSPPVAAFASQEDCSFDVQFLNMSDSATSFSWDFGDGSTSLDPAPLHTYVSTGWYTVTLTGMNSYGCTDTVSRLIEVVVFSPAAFLPTYDSCLMEARFVSTSVNAGSYYWDLGDGTTSEAPGVIHTYPYSGNFELLFITNPGTACADTLLETFEAAPFPEHGFYIPNCFTPNGDGLNERFGVLDFGTCHSYQLLIFNRWGELIFETDDLNQTWDGKYKGADVPEDVYAYLLKGKDKIKQGSVLVLK